MINLKTSDAETVTNLIHIAHGYKHEVTTKLHENINWNRVFTTFNTYQNSYNDSMMRFVKSNIFCKGLQRWSKGYLRYDDKTGFDFTTSDDYKIELKSGIKMFQHRVQTTTDLIIHNMQGSSATQEYVDSMQKTFDYLLVIDPDMAAICTWEDAKQYMRPCGDSVRAKIPLEKMEMFKISGTVKETEIQLKDRIYDAIDMILDDIETICPDSGS